MVPLTALLFKYYVRERFNNYRRATTFSPTIQHLIEQESSAFLIPVSKIVFVQKDAPLCRALLILTKARYAKISILGHRQQIVGLLSLSMITEKMLTGSNISVEPLSYMKISEAMQTKFTTINFVNTTMKAQLHLLINNPSIPAVNDSGVFQGLPTRREWAKVFNYMSHELDQKYSITEK